MPWFCPGITSDLHLKEQLRILARLAHAMRSSSKCHPPWPYPGVLHLNSFRQAHGILGRGGRASCSPILDLQRCFSADFHCKVPGCNKVQPLHLPQPPPPLSHHTLSSECTDNHCSHAGFSQNLTTEGILSLSRTTKHPAQIFISSGHLKIYGTWQRKSSRVGFWWKMILKMHRCSKVNKESRCVCAACLGMRGVVICGELQWRSADAGTFFMRCDTSRLPLIDFLFFKSGLGCHCKRQTETSRRQTSLERDN